MTLSRIHVNKHVVASNRVHGRNDPPISVKTRGENIRCHGVEILGPAVVMHVPNDPLACGAKIWIETESPLKIYRTPLKGRRRIPERTTK